MTSVMNEIVLQIAIIQSALTKKVVFPAFNQQKTKMITPYNAQTFHKASILTSILE